MLAPDFQPQSPCEKAKYTGVTYVVFVIPVLGRLRQEDPPGWLASLGYLGSSRPVKVPSQKIRWTSLEE